MDEPPSLKSFTPFNYWKGEKCISSAPLFPHSAGSMWVDSGRIRSGEYFLTKIAEIS